MIKSEIFLWKIIGGNRRLYIRVGVRIRVILFYSELAPTDPWCDTLQTLFEQKKHEEAISDEHPIKARLSISVKVVKAFNSAFHLLVIIQRYKKCENKIGTYLSSWYWLLRQNINFSNDQVFCSKQLVFQIQCGKNLIRQKLWFEFPDFLYQNLR